MQRAQPGSERASDLGARRENRRYLERFSFRDLKGWKISSRVSNRGKHTAFPGQGIIRKPYKNFIGPYKCRCAAHGERDFAFVHTRIVETGGDERGGRRSANAGPAMDQQRFFGIPAADEAQ